MSANKYKYFAEKFQKADIGSLLEQPFKTRDADRKELHEGLFKPTSTAYKTKCGTLGRLIEQLKEAERYLGSDVEVFVRDKEGIHMPQIVIERTPNELPVDAIVTIQ